MDFEALNHIKKWLPRKQFIVIGVRLKDERVYNLQYISEKDNVLSLENYYSDITEDTLDTYLKTEVPVILSFQGDKVISRDIAQDVDVGTLLFKEDKDAFFISQLSHLSNNYVSIVRKEEVLGVLNVLKEKTITVIDFSIGPFNTIGLKDFLSNSIVVSDHTEFEFLNTTEEFKYIKVGEVTSRYTLGSDLLDQYQISLVASYFNYKNQLEVIDFKEELLKYDISEFKKHRIFTTSLVTVVVLILVSLMISTFLRFRYQDQYVEVESQLFFLEKSYNEITSLDNEKEQLQSLISNLSGFSEEYYTHYVYYLIQKLPKGIQLDAIDLNPLKGRLTKNKDAQFTINQIHINGRLNRSESLNEWTQAIKKMEWVRSFEVVELFENRNNELIFTLQIDY